MLKSKSLAASKYIILACGLLILLLSSTVAEKPNHSVPVPVPAVIDNSTFIDANEILMFVTNHGNFGRDLAGLFGHDYGTYYPYVDTSRITSGDLINSVIYSSGCWLGAIDEATGQTLVAVSEYSSEYVPGPMIGGTFVPDNPYFRVYKLEKGAARGQLSADFIDYVDYAIPELNAPADSKGNPLLLGKQTLWTVFNDADPDAHRNNAGETPPLGVEIQMSVWANDEPGKSPVFNSDQILSNTEFELTQLGDTYYEAVAYAVDPTSITCHQYQVIIEGVETFEGVDTVWHLDNITTNTRLLSSQPLNCMSNVVEGFVVAVYEFEGAGVFTSFEVVANAGGVIDPPAAGAFAFAGFPTPDGQNPDGSQQVGDGLWGIHTADNGGTCGGGTRRDYEAFLARVTRDGANVPNISGYDYEMRFTGSYDNPGVGGSYVIEVYNDDNVFWVPFELWRTGMSTPDDPSDDIRLVAWIIDDWGEYWQGNDEYGLESWGCTLDPSSSGEGEHSVSGGDDDPFTDWVYWRMPSDSSFGEAGYAANAASMLSGNYDFDLTAYEVMARTVLVNWNAGEEPPFGQDCPEQGTVFRIGTQPMGELPADTFLFTSSAPESIPTGPEGQSIYISYKFYNEGGKTLRNCYFSLWSDPDVGAPGDDLVGCDTLDNVFYAYNGNGADGDYGYNVPATGFKFIYGPVIPSEGDSACFDRSWIQGYENLNMSAFVRYINGTDPDNFDETYKFMQGLTKGGAPYVYNGDELTYHRSGDPVTGTGDVDYVPDDRRMMGTCGPFDFMPGDSQYVLVKVAVAQGTDRLNSITKLRDILNLPFELKLPGPKSKLPAVPDKFAVSQNYPNPFNPSTTINYALPEQARVTVDVYNILGQKVLRLVDEDQTAGVHSVVWNGTDESGDEVSTGFYFYRVKAGDHAEKKKMLLLK